VGSRCANHVTPLYPQKLALTSSTGGGRSVGMVRLRTKATEYYNITRISLEEHTQTRHSFFQDFVVVQMRSALFCDFTHRRIVFFTDVSRQPNVSNIKGSIGCLEHKQGTTILPCIQSKKSPYFKYIITFVIILDEMTV
jgi:hypothetical protein